MITVTIKENTDLANSLVVRKLLSCLKDNPEGVEEFTIQGQKEDYTFQGESLRIVNSRLPFRVVCEN